MINIGEIWETVDGFVVAILKNFGDNIYRVAEVCTDPECQKFMADFDVKVEVGFIKLWHTHSIHRLKLKTLLCKTDEYLCDDVEKEIAQKIKDDSEYDQFVQRELWKCFNTVVNNTNEVMNTIDL